MNRSFKETADTRLAALTADIDTAELLRQASAQNVRSGRNIRRLAVALAVMTLLAALSVSALALTGQDNAEQDNLNLYIRYLSPEELAVFDAQAEEKGAQAYFDGLQSDDPFEQYLCINKLVEYYNDEDIRTQAVAALQPFMNHSESKLREAAKFSLSVLTQTFDSPYIVTLYDDIKVFTLFHDYSDYGSLNQIWMIRDGELSLWLAFTAPQMYITELNPSPDGKKMAVSTCSNKSKYLTVFDVAEGMVSPELVDSARILVGKDKDYDVWQRPDFENYCEMADITWLDADTISFRAELSYNNMEIVETVQVEHRFAEKRMTWTPA